MEATKKRKINTRQLTAIKATKNNGKRVFYFRYYCPDLQKDNMDRSKGTRIHHFERLKQVISFAVDEGYLFKQHETMIDRARPPRGEETEIQIPSEESIAKLIGACNGFWKAIVNPALSCSENV